MANRIWEVLTPGPPSRAVVVVAAWKPVRVEKVLKVAAPSPTAMARPSVGQRLDVKEFIFLFSGMVLNRVEQGGCEAVDANEGEDEKDGCHKDHATSHSSAGHITVDLSPIVAESYHRAP